MFVSVRRSVGPRDEWGNYLPPRGSYRDWEPRRGFDGRAISGAAQLYARHETVRHDENLHSHLFTYVPGEPSSDPTEYSVTSDNQIIFPIRFVSMAHLCAFLQNHAIHNAHLLHRLREAMYYNFIRMDNR